MSENEKLQRLLYQQWRKGVIRILLAVTAAFLAVALVCSLIFFAMDKETYVYYSEDGQVIYYAYLADNEFYDVDHLNGSHAYVTELIDHMTGDFRYDLKMGTSDVQYRYSYRIEAQLEILDNVSKAAIFNPTYEILPQQSWISSGQTLSIQELVEIDYNKYNDLAKTFLDTYQLTGTTSSLTVRMYVDVVGMSESFASDNAGQYVIELRVPLAETTVKPQVSTSVPSAQQKILAKDNSLKARYLAAAFAFSTFASCVAICLATYCKLTENKHIDYAKRVRQLLANYQSYIQKIQNEFDADGFQLLYVDNFSQMLSLRDTLQQPILMFENEDKTCTRFFITTDAKIMYLFEVKVEDDE